MNESIDDDDEVLLVLAEKLGTFIPLIGGKEHAFHLLKPLEQLVMVEESTVREKAIISISTVVRELSAEDIVAHFVPLLRRVSTIVSFGPFFCCVRPSHVPKTHHNDVDGRRRRRSRRRQRQDWFTSRISACSLFEQTYHRVDAGLQTEYRCVGLVRARVVCESTNDVPSFPEQQPSH